MTDPASRQERAVLNGLLAGQRAGAYTLPESFISGLEAEDRLREQLYAARGEQQRLRSTGQVIGDLADDVLAAAVSAAPMPDLAERVREAEQAQRVAEIQVEVLEQALDAAGSQALTFNPHEIVTRHLRPAFEEVLSEVKALAPKLAGRDLADAEQFLDGPDAARKAYTRLRELSARHERIRRAQYALNRGTADSANYFAEMKNQRELYGSRWQGHLQSHWKPWPADSLAYLVWLATSDAQPWCPTREERDQALQEMYAEVERSRRRSPAAAGY